jgi:hypothetical protein
VSDVAAIEVEKWQKKEIESTESNQTDKDKIEDGL